MRTLYLIPARAGSKGLPGKNIKKLGGKPLIEFSIDFALKHLKEEDELCVSTNDSDVIQIVKNKELKLHFRRPEELSTDIATTQDVILHALDYFQSIAIFFDRVFLLQPTSPFRTDSDWNAIVSAYDDSLDMVVSVKKTKENPYFTLFEENEGGFIVKSKPGNYSSRQECPAVYLFNGSMYLINVKSIREKKINVFQKVKKIIMPEERSVDIDTMADWVMAEFYLKKNENS
jgi:CMP-N,N'-diacetyllegionaminic acid synthase